MARALYRKYRPKTLTEVLGQEKVTLPLENALKENKISHAYLFVGPRGTGKTSVARIFAHAVNNFDYEIEDTYVDIVEIDGASNRGIDNIRDLKESVITKPTLGKYKVYIIDEVHMLTKDAFNALLKTLEEPPAHVIFILATTDVEKVPITITSRAQVFTFELATPEIMVPHLQTICEKEGTKIDLGALNLIAKRGGGSFRDTLSLLDQISTLSDSEITEATIEKVLGLPRDAQIMELLETYKNGVLDDNQNLDFSKSVVKITTLLESLLSTGLKAETLSEKIIETILKNPRPEWLPLLEELIEVKTPFPEAKLLVALTKCFFKNPAFIKPVAPAVAAMATTITSSPATINPTPTTPLKLAEAETPGATPETIETTSETSPAFSKPAETTENVATKTPKPISEKTNSVASFSWETYLDLVKTLNDSIFTQLSKCKYEISDNTLDVFPDKKIIRAILSRENNQKILTEALANYQTKTPTSVVKITIHEVGETPINEEKDPLISQISDIMGGEVSNDRGGDPF